MNTRAVLRFLPAPFWCYMLPMLAGSLGWLPKESAVYSFVSQQLLPVCLVLLLIGTDVQALARLGLPAVRIMLAGAVGTIAGGIASFFLYKRWLPLDSWGAVGALTASWIGGSANLLAVKEALGVSDSLVGPIILVDAVVAYSWMALLIAASGWEPAWNARVGSSPVISAMHRSARPSESRLARSEVLARRGQGTIRDTVPARTSERALPKSPATIFFGLTLAIAISLLAQGVAARLPVLPGIGASTWTVLLVTTTALALSLTPLRRLEEAGVSKAGTWALYLLLITIGARANIQSLWNAPVFLALGLTWIAIHGGILLAAGYFWKTPLGLIATASQANIGGAISAPLVGATYAPPLAGIGLLLAVLGNILGTYLGLLSAALLQALF